ncbi:MAG: hypothetical protein M1820_002204 [Bogoriella megaspora]|nr:MAG: hypothetical protein M1820_002204 [Bogoriella megaspora]
MAAAAPNHSPPQTLSHLLSLLPPTLPIAPHSPDASLTPLISAPQFHPALEALLHLLNSDLPSAHFLCRHMQAPPAVEGMLLHAILHRMEGDFENARAWLRSVGKDKGDDGDGVGEGGRHSGTGGIVERGLEGHGHRDQGRGVRLLKFVGSGTSESWAEGNFNGDGDVDPVRRAIGLVDAVETFRKHGEGDEGALRKALEYETARLLQWCKEEFGEERWEDASVAWVRPGEDVRKIGEDMVSGGKGWREF